MPRRNLSLRAAMRTPDTAAAKEAVKLTKRGIVTTPLEPGITRETAELGEEPYERRSGMVITPLEPKINPQIAKSVVNQYEATRINRSCFSRWSSTNSQSVVRLLKQYLVNEDKESLLDALIERFPDTLLEKFPDTEQKNPWGDTLNQILQNERIDLISEMREPRNNSSQFTAARQSPNQDVGATGKDPMLMRRYFEEHMDDKT